MFNDKQRSWKIFSGEEIPTWVSCGGQSRGCRVGKLLFPVSQDWQQGLPTHEQTLTRFLLQKVTGTTRLEMSIKNVHVFTVTALCHLCLCCNSGRSPGLRCCSRGCGGSQVWVLCGPLADSDQSRSATARTAINPSPGVVRPSHGLVSIYDFQGIKIASVAACDRAEIKDEETATREAGEVTYISGDCLETSHFVELLQHVVLWTNSF